MVRKPRARTGMLPNEYRRRSLVNVERLAHQGEPGSGLTVTDNWIVVSQRLDGVWSHVAELNGTRTVLPGKVVERILAQRQAIVTEARSVVARDRIMAQAEAALAQAE